MLCNFCLRKKEDKTDVVGVILPWTMGFPNVLARLRKAMAASKIHLPAVRVCCGEFFYVAHNLHFLPFGEFLSTFSPMNAKQTLSQWLTDGDLERTLNGLLLIQKKWRVKSMGNHEFDTSFQLSRFNTLKTSHSKGTISQADYLMELARIRETTTETVHWLPEDYWLEELTNVPPTQLPESSKLSGSSHDTPRPSWWKRWEFILGLLVTLATVTGITLKDFFCNSYSGNPTSLTVFAYDAKKGKQYPILQAKGHIWLDLNGERKQEAIDDKGKAVFQNLHIGDHVLLDVAFSEPYRAVRPDSIYGLPASGQIYLAVELKNLERIRGHIFYKEKPLSGVVVSVENLRDTTDGLGFYELQIPPELRKREQKLLLYHPKIGTQTETVYPQTDQDWDFVLKK